MKILMVLMSHDVLGKRVTRLEGGSSVGSAALQDSQLARDTDIASVKGLVSCFHRISSTHCAREGPGSNASPKYWVSRATFPSLNSMMLTV